MNIASKVILSFLALVPTGSDAALRGAANAGGNKRNAAAGYDAPRELSTAPCVSTFSNLVTAIDTVAPNNSTDLDNNIVRICPGSVISFPQPIVVGPKAVDIRCQLDATSPIVANETCILDGGSISRGILSFDEYSIALRGLLFRNFHQERTTNAYGLDRKEIGAALVVTNRHVNDLPVIPLIEIENCQFRGNTISIKSGASIDFIRYGGAAIYIDEADEIRIKGSLFDSNGSTSPVKFGAIAELEFKTKFVFQDSVFTNNYSPGGFLDRPTQKLTHLGLLTTYGYRSQTTEFSGNYFADNRASPDVNNGETIGSVIFLSENEDTTITNNVFERNVGTPLYAEYGNSLTLSNNRFLNNRGHYGGGLETKQPTTMTNNTFSYNTAVEGGAVWAGGDIRISADLEVPPDFLVSNSIFEYNSASSYGGAFYIEDVTPSPFEGNNIFRGNHVPVASPLGCDDIAREVYRPYGSELPLQIDCLWSIGSHEYYKGQKLSFTNYERQDLGLSVGDGQDGPYTAQVTPNGGSARVFFTSPANCPIEKNPATSNEPYCLHLRHVDSGRNLYVKAYDQGVYTATRDEVMDLGTWVIQNQDSNCNGQSCNLLVNAETGLRLNLGDDQSTLDTTDVYNDPTIVNNQRWLTTIHD